MKLSIVVPIYNQKNALDLTLFWLERTVDDECEVIVIDDESDENLLEIVDRYNTKLNIKYIRNTHSGRAVSRNLGIKNAEGERILFNDGDRFPANSTILYHKKMKGIVTGRLMEYYFSNPEKKINSLKYEFNTLKKKARDIAYPSLIRKYLFNEQGECVSNMGWMSFLTGNVSAPRDALLDVGGFDEAYVSWGVEHFDLGYRLWKSGLSFEFVDFAENYHIAHRRDSGFYQNNLDKSIDYFYNKYKDPQLLKFKEFMFGKISLQSLERHSIKFRFDVAPWLYKEKEDIYFRSLQSNILARS